MANKYFKTAGIVGAFFYASLSYGQVKLQPVPNFVNPFQSKTNQKANTVIVQVMEIRLQAFNSKNRK